MSIKQKEQYESYNDIHPDTIYNKPICSSTVIHIYNIKTKTGRYKLGREIQAELSKHGKIKLLSVDNVKIV